MDLRGDRSLTLRYIPHNRAPLDRGRKEVLKHVHRLWGFDVMLEQAKRRRQHRDCWNVARREWEICKKQTEKPLV